MYTRRNVNFQKVNLPLISKCTFTLAKLKEEMRLEMLVTITVSVLFLSPSASSDGWTCAINIGKTWQCILGEMVNFQKVNLPLINKCTFTLAKFVEDMQLKMLATMTMAVLFCFSGSDGWTCALGIEYEALYTRRNGQLPKSQLTINE